MLIPIFIFIALLFSACNFIKTEDHNLKQLSPKYCKEGLYFGPQKHFAVYVFCDDAVGTTIGIINTSPGAYAGPGSEKAWHLDSRFWQENNFSRDVESIDWSSEGKKIIIRTGETYGTDKTYFLDLLNKKIEKEIEN